jgi:hypothetical protein
MQLLLLLIACLTPLLLAVWMQAQQRVLVLLVRQSHRQQLTALQQQCVIWQQQV